MSLIGQVAELEYALALEASAERLESSNLSLPTLEDAGNRRIIYYTI